MMEINFDERKRKAILSGEYLDDIREHFSVKNEASKFSKGRYIPSRTYAITNTGRFDAPLFSEILKFIETKTPYKESDIKISANFFSEIYPSKYNWSKNENFNLDEYPLNLKLRDYQKEIVDKAFSHGRGTVVLATAGGKTLVMAALLSKIFSINNELRCCLIVPNRSLVEQTYRDFLDYGVPFKSSKWTGDDSLNLSSNVIICNSSIMLSKNSNLDWMNELNVIFVDECHHIKRSNSITKIIDKCKTPNKFGFTGTLPEDKMDQWTIIGKLGPVIFQKKSFELREGKYVVPAVVQIIEIHYKNPPKRSFFNSSSTENYKNEIDFLKTNDFRNESILKISANTNNNLLILLDYIDHGEIVFNLLKNKLKNKKVFFIKGDVEVSDREKIRKLMEDNNDVICVAISKIFSTGINIKNLHYIIFAGGGKSKIKVLQSIGRGLRLNSNKKTLYIIDLADQLYYGVKHQEKRRELYDQEKISQQILKLYEK